MSSGYSEKNMRGPDLKRSEPKEADDLNRWR